MSDWSRRSAPDLADLDRIARAELARIPEPLRRHVGDVVIRIEDFPSAEVETEMRLQSPFDLLGLYQGVSLDQKSVTEPGGDVDMIFLYRRPLLDAWCDSGDTLGALVRNVLVHEIGHHFGLSDDEMERLESDG